MVLTLVATPDPEGFNVPASWIADQYKADRLAVARVTSAMVGRSTIPAAPFATLASLFNARLASMAA